MDKVTFHEIETPSGLQDFAIIEHSDGSYTSMPKSTWDEIQAKQTEGGLR